MSIFKKVILIFLILFLIFASVIFFISKEPLDRYVLGKAYPIALNLPKTEIISDQNNEAQYSHTIEKGDTLSSIFEAAKVSQKTMYKVLEADLDILALDTLKIGNSINFWLDEEGKLTKLELYFNRAKQVVFSRYPDGDYKVEEINTDGIWQYLVIKGLIKGSFYVSAKKAGLKAADIQFIENLLQDKLNFSKDLRANDKFSVLLSEQYVEGIKTGDRQILAIHLENRMHGIDVYADADGIYYDKSGRSLLRAFLRYPLAKEMRVTSKFNPFRKHPVTGRIQPHNGVDFSTKIGTKIICPGDGVVTLVTYHPFAGNYIVVQHGRKYKTRYLHLSKALVKKGDVVKRGQILALSGNTGRTTGPHLHYEFHINNIPVNPMTADIPMQKELEPDKMPKFMELVKRRNTILGIDN